jgi:hypothetical protein
VILAREVNRRCRLGSSRNCDPSRTVARGMRVVTERSMSVYYFQFMYQPDVPQHSCASSCFIMTLLRSYMWSSATSPAPMQIRNYYSPHQGQKKGKKGKIQKHIRLTHLLTYSRPRRHQINYIPNRHNLSPIKPIPIKRIHTRNPALLPLINQTHSGTNPLDQRRVRIERRALGVCVDEWLRDQVERHGLAAEEPFIYGCVDDVA